jgi:uncharacterized repeat protein (TIGR03803 family)
MKNRFFGGVLACLVFVWFTDFAAAQVIQPICYFTNSPFNSPRNLRAGLTLGVDRQLYGSTSFGGGTSDFGTIFKVTTSGASTMVANLDSTTGGDPYASLTLGPDSHFYGVGSVGGPVGEGGVFKMDANGVVSPLFGFKASAWSGSAITNQDGGYPYGGLTLGPDGSYYGTTTQGGTNGGGGTIFKITTNGLLTTLVALGNPNGSADPNAYGGSPYGRMALAPDGNFYGTTFLGGYQGNGTVFRMTPTGAFTTLFRFGNTNGSEPDSDLVLGPDNCLYGTTLNGGSGGDGTVFKITTNGVLTTLVNFDFTTGAAPMGGVTLAPDGYFYGTLSTGGYGTNAGGGVFRMSITGALTILGVFSGTNGYYPESQLTVGPDGNLYGTTYEGGPDLNGAGVVFRVNIAPTNGNQLPIAVTPDGIAVLHLAVAVGSTNRLWATTNPYLPLAHWQVLATNVAANGFFDFQDTNTAGYPAKFYRLSMP